MKKILIILIILAFSITAVQSKSYHYDYINITLDFNPDGSVLVHQTRNYNFDGSFSWAFIDFKKAGAKDIRIIDIKDMDTGLSVPFKIENYATNVKVTWNYSAYNENKKFEIIYEIEDSVKRYQDVAEFYWKVIEEEHEFIDNFHGEINLPQSSPSLFKVFVHSIAQPGALAFSDDLKKSIVDMNNIPKDSFVEFRVLTSPDIFYETPLNPIKKYEAILEEERRIFEPSKVPVFTTIPSEFITFYSFTNSPIFFVVLIAIPIIVFIYFYLRYGVEPKVDYKLKYEPEPPRDIPPMALATIYGDDIKTSANGLLATIFDLARRGYIEIREEKKERLFGLGEKTEQIFKITKEGRKALSPKSSLLDFERDVLSLIFDDMSKSKDEISSSEMTKWCRKHQSILMAISSLNKDAKSWFEKTYFKLYEPKSFKKANKFLAFLVVYGIFIFVVLFLKTGFFAIDFLVSILIVSAPIAFLIVKAIYRRTPEATLEIKRWNAFKRYISDFSAMKDAPMTLLHIWDRYLIYAVVLGVAKKLLENIKHLSLVRNEPVVGVVWYHPIGTPGIPTGMMSPESFSAFSSNMNNMIKALSSSSSVGGGFSGGGGVGGGGGGGGGGGSSGAG